MSLRRENLVTFLDAALATWAWSGKIATDFRNATFAFATDGWADAALTVKFQWSAAEVEPDWDSAQSVTNMWDFIETVDLEDWTAIDWDTWISVATADDYRQLAANVDGMRWINCIVTARTQWEVTVKWYLFSND